MSDYSTVDDPMLCPVPLTSVRVKDGAVYHRFPDVEEEIMQVLRSENTQAQLLASLGRLKTQTLVYFTRHTTNHHLIGQLIHEITERAVNIVAKNCRGYNPTDVDAIAGEVVINLARLLLADPPTRTSENLEVDFDGAIRQQTLKLHRKFKDVPKPGMFDSASTTTAGNPIDALVDQAASPLEQLIDNTTGPQLRRLLKAIKKPKHRKAFILRVLRGWPMTDADPSIPTVTAFFGLRPQQARNVQYWIDRAIKEMREALGDPQ